MPVPGSSTLRARLLTVDVTGLVALVGSLVVASRQHPRPLPCLLALLALVGVRFVQVPIRLGERRVLVGGYAEGAALLSLVLLPPGWPALTVAAVTLVGQLTRRIPPWRAGFNVAAVLAPTACAEVVYRAALGSGAWRLLLALLLAALTLNMLNLLSVSGVVAAAHGEPWLPALRSDLPTEVGGTALQVLLCTAAVVAWRQGDYVLLGLLPVTAWLSVLQLMRRMDDRTRVDALTRLEEATQPVAGLEPGAVAQELLGRAAALFGVESAWISVDTWPGAGQTSWRHPDGEDLRDPTTGSLVTRELVGPSGRLGSITLRMTREARLDRAEQQVLNAFLATANAALLHCQAYAEQVVSARTDALTGLGNRLALADLVRALPADAAGALMLIDLDHFKQINDTLGHPTGDAFLCEVGRRLRRRLRPGDVAVRLGGDEFVVLLPAPPGRELTADGALALGREVLQRLSDPVRIEGLELPVEGSAGLVLLPPGDRDPRDLLRRADVAMYRAKATRGVVCLAGDDEETDARALQLLGQLQSGLRLGEIVVHHQPVVDLATGVVVGTEALVRWQHPEQGLLAPGAFIPAVEQTSLIVPLTLEVLDQAVARTVGWARRRPGLGVAVNISPRCLLAPEFALNVLDVLHLHGLPPSSLTVEVTETLAIADPLGAEQALAPLRRAGVLVSLDDFGTGYSSMSALRRLTVDEVKIDRGFVAGAVEVAADRAVVEATVTLARGLGVHVVAEGIETPEALALVRALGCQRGQGFLLGRPVPPEAMTELLARGRAARSGHVTGPGAPSR